MLAGSVGSECWQGVLAGSVGSELAMALVARQVKNSANKNLASMMKDPALRKAMGGLQVGADMNERICNR